MYEDIIEALNLVVDAHRKESDLSSFYLVQGIKVAQQIITQTQEHNTEEVAYETFECVVKSLKDSLNCEEMLEIVENESGIYD